MITKSALWEQIRAGLKEFKQSDRIAQTVMERIRSLESEVDTRRTLPPNKRGN